MTSKVVEHIRMKPNAARSLAEEEASPDTMSMARVVMISKSFRQKNLLCFFSKGCLYNNMYLNIIEMHKGNGTNMVLTVGFDD